MTKIPALAGAAMVVVVGLWAWSLPPRPLAVLEEISSAERLAFFRSGETSEVVGYYCGAAPLSPALRRDIEQSLREDHGVLSCRSRARRRIVPSADAR